jgi:hypothetical protein
MSTLEKQLAESLQSLSKQHDQQVKQLTGALQQCVKDQAVLAEQQEQQAKQIKQLSNALQALLSQFNG